MGINLQQYYPFNKGDAALLTEAQRRGTIRQYKAGEMVFKAGEAAERIALILEGQVFCSVGSPLTDYLETKYSPGCFIGLEALQEESVYHSCATARTPLQMITWQKADAARMVSDSLQFAQAMTRLQKGQVFRENTSLPEIDAAEAILTVERLHPLYLAVRFLATIFLCALCLWLNSLLLRHSGLMPVIAGCLMLAGIFYLVHSVSDWKNEQLIITPKNIVHLSARQNMDSDVIRLASIQSARSEEFPFASLVSVGSLVLNAYNRELSFSPLSDPQDILAMINSYRGRLLMTNDPLPSRMEPSDISTTEAPADAAFVPVQVPDEPAPLSDFRPVEFHAHWGHLVSMIIKPCILFTALLILTLEGMRGGWKILSYPHVKPFLFVTFLLLIFWILYAFLDWINDRFIIQEDCVKDFNRKPFTREDINIAMVQKIQSVRFQRDGIFQMVFNYGTVFILAGEGELIFDFVPHPQEVQQQILDVCARYERKRQLEEEERQHTYIADLVHTIKTT